MGKQFVWTPVSILALILAAILGWFLRTPHTLAKEAPIDVGPDAGVVNPPSVNLSKSAGDTARWTLHDKGGATDAVRDLYIEFEDQEIFPRSKAVPGSNPTRYRVPCSGAFCLSGSIGPDAKIEKDYKYWQFIQDAAGNLTHADGHIIIKQ